MQENLSFEHDVETTSLEELTKAGKDGLRAAAARVTTYWDNVNNVDGQDTPYDSALAKVYRAWFNQGGHKLEDDQTASALLFAQTLAKLAFEHANCAWIARHNNKGANFEPGWVAHLFGDDAHTNANKLARQLQGLGKGPSAARKQYKLTRTSRTREAIIERLIENMEPEEKEQDEKITQIA